MSSTTILDGVGMAPQLDALRAHRNIVVTISVRSRFLCVTNRTGCSTWASYSTSSAWRGRDIESLRELRATKRSRRRRTPHRTYGGSSARIPGGAAAVVSYQAAARFASHRPGTRTLRIRSEGHRKAKQPGRSHGFTKVKVRPNPCPRAAAWPKGDPGWRSRKRATCRRPCARRAA